MIRLSRLSDYGIVILTRLAREQGRALPASTLAQSTAVSAAMTGKVLKLLARADLLTSQRGAHGGYALSRPPTAVSVAEIIEALDGPIALTSCVDPTAGECGIERLCPARANWQRINRAIRDALNGITLADMAQAMPEAFRAPPDPEPAARGTARPATEQAGTTFGAG